MYYIIFFKPNTELREKKYGKYCDCKLKREIAADSVPAGKHKFVVISPLWLHKPNSMPVGWLTGCVDDRGGDFVWWDDQLVMQETGPTGNTESDRNTAICH